MVLPLSRSLQALSDPTRRRILELLQQRDLTAGEIGAQFPISAPSVSHHLATLKNAGLVECERHGQTLVYSLNATVVQELLGELLRLFGRGAAESASSPEVVARRERPGEGGADVPA